MIPCRHKINPWSTTVMMVRFT